MIEPRPRVFVDTNVWISAVINPGDSPFRVLQAFLNEQLIAVISESSLSELQEVISRPRIRRRIPFTDDAIQTVLKRLSETGIRVNPTGNLRICRDPKDDILLETAIPAEADYVVSRDDDMKRDLDLIAHLRERGIEVVSGAQFLDLLADR